MTLREIERISESLSHRFNVVDAARELPFGSEIRLAIDADQQGSFIPIVPRIREVPPSSE
jgi:hypothetical protein